MARPRGVLVSVSCAPCSARVIEVATVARERDIPARHHGTCQFPAGPRATLLVGHQSSLISNSSGAFMMVAECLVTACAACRPDQTRAAPQTRSRAISRLGVEV